MYAQEFMRGSSQVSLVSSPSPQFVHLSRERGKVAAVTTSAHWGERRGCGYQSCTLERTEAVAVTHNPD